MIRTRLAQAAAVLALALGTVVLVPTTAGATAPTSRPAAAAQTSTTAGVSPSNLTWG